MKSSRPESAHCRSSNTSTTAGRGDPLEEQPPAAEQVGAIGCGALLESSRCASRGSTSRRSRSSETNSSTVARSLAGAEAGSSSSTIPARARTISASAQYATPSP